MGSFLRDIMDPTTSHDISNGNTIGMLPDVLDFSIDDYFDFGSIPTDGDQLPVTQPTQTTEIKVSRTQITSGTMTPTVRKAVDIGQEAFRDSMWLWTPAKEDHLRANQVFFNVPNGQSAIGAHTPDATIHCKLSQSSRDRILTLILCQSGRNLQRHIATCFPSPDFLSSILDTFMVHHSRHTIPWIHLTSMNLNEEDEELLLSMLCYGAAYSKHSEVQRLGFALQETARSMVPQKFEEDNRNTRDLRILQAYSLLLVVGLWSGSRRKIEISESFAQCFITMLRRGGQFRKKSGSMSEINDKMVSNDTRWKQWIYAESFKRLSYQAFLEDTYTSMSLLNPPLITSTEIYLELPFASEFWQAESADEWNQLCQARLKNVDQGLPSLRACLADMGILSKQHGLVDIQMSLTIIVATIWSRVWQWRQMKAMLSLSATDCNALTVSAYGQEIITLCKQLELSYSDLKDDIGYRAKVMLELCQMHLHVSLEDIQLFAGKEGEEEARKSLSILRLWAGSQDSRQALFHAGQVLKAASEHPYGTLREFAAVGVYHASLIMWAYAVLTEQLSSFHSTRSTTDSETCLIRLDGDEAPNILQRFLMLGKGRPCIRKYSENGMEDGSITTLTDPMGIMTSIVGLLASKNGDERIAPPIVCNLSKLIHSLGKVANVMKHSRV